MVRTLLCLTLFAGACAQPVPVIDANCGGFCAANAVCQAKATNAADYECVCNSGYSGDGLTCSDVNECSKIGACDANAVCANLIGSYSCSCKSGFSGTGSTCHDVDECAQKTAGCDANAKCSNTVGSATCTCNSGFTGDGKICSDVDECANGTGSCGLGAECSNTVGSFSCVCKTGYSGDGKTCKDVNECEVKPSPCDKNATCSNTIGSFSCACSSGFSGDGKKCADIDECSAKTATCASAAVCTNTPGSYACACPSGYSGDGKTCDDIDECSEKLPKCDANATCANAPGSFTCTCKTGFVGDGSSCKDLDECSGAINPCGSLPCTNTTGSFACGCGAGMATVDGKCVVTSAELSIASGAASVNSTAVKLFIVPPGNLLNATVGGWGGFESGDVSGWTSAACGDGWTFPAGIFGKKAAQGSYCQESLSLTLDLVQAGLSASALDGKIPLFVGIFAAGGWPKDDTVSVSVGFLDDKGTSLSSVDSGKLTATVGTWDGIATASDTYPVGTRKLSVTIGEQDGEFWAGNYGTLLDGIAITAGKIEMRVSNEDGVWGNWQIFNSTLDWTLSSGAGSKQVSIEFRDGNGKSLGIVSDDIGLQ